MQVPLLRQGTARRWKGRQLQTQTMKHGTGGHLQPRDLFEGGFKVATGGVESFSSFSPFSYIPPPPHLYFIGDSQYKTNPEGGRERDGTARGRAKGLYEGCGWTGDQKSSSGGCHGPGFAW